MTNISVYNKNFYKTLILQTPEEIFYEILPMDLKILRDILKEKNITFEMIYTTSLNFNFIDVIIIKSNTLINLLYSGNTNKIKLALNLIKI